MITRRNRNGRLVSFDENALAPLKATKYQEHPVYADGAVVFKELLVHFKYWGHEDRVFTQSVGCN